MKASFRFTRPAGVIIVKTMQNRKLKRFIYTFKHRYITINNVVLMIAAIIAVSWVWASVQAVQHNYVLQRQVDDKRRQQKLVELQTQNLQYEQKYYKSQEYLSLEAKRRLGLAEPGEKVIVLPPNSAQAKAVDAVSQSPTIVQSNLPEPSPFEQWMDFLFGGNRQGLQNKQ